MNTTTAINGLISIEKSQISGIISPEGKMPNLEIILGVAALAAIIANFFQYRSRRKLIAESRESDLREIRWRKMLVDYVEQQYGKMYGENYQISSYGIPDIRKTLENNPLHSTILVREHDREYSLLEFRIEWGFDPRLTVTVDHSRVMTEKFSFENLERVFSEHTIRMPLPFLIDSNVKAARR
ncbi:MAG TPA: hypothetical protein VHF05_01410 [Candidatus Paceibacterota bacterium]|nr:hypothetical protein [Candidatus Paceibacterota bacterium]